MRWPCRQGTPMAVMLAGTRELPSSICTISACRRARLRGLLGRRWAGCVFTCYFDIVGAGETEVVRQYFPTWEEPTDTAGRFAFTVRVG